MCCAPTQMNLLDRAVKLAAEQDEPDEVNFVRKHAKEQVRMAALHRPLAEDLEQGFRVS